MVRYRFAQLGALLLLCSGCGDDEPASKSVADASAVTDVATPTTMPEPEPMLPGQATFEHYCADCHNAGEGHPGTMRLAARVGADNSVLRERQDLPPAYVKQVVRNGFQMMPPFRPSEIADGELDALAEFVAVNYAAETDPSE